MFKENDIIYLCFVKNSDRFVWSTIIVFDLVATLCFTAEPNVSIE